MGVSIFDREVVTTENYSGVHHAIDEVLEDTATFSIHRITMQGKYEDLKAIRDEHYCNEVLQSGDDTFWKDIGMKSDLVINAMTLSRREGLRGTLTILVKAFRRGYEGGIDFEQVGKDIHNWRALCSSDKPYLGNILLWEQMKNDVATAQYYKDFKYLDSTGAAKSLTDGIPSEGGYTGGATTALANMIFRGVETFNEYVPMLTVTYTLAAHPVTLGVQNFSAGGFLGKVVLASDLTLDGEGFQIPIGYYSASPSPASEFEALVLAFDGVILCTADQLRCNSDGSYTLTRCFAGYRAVEKELYLGAGGSYGPYDNKS